MTDAGGPTEDDDGFRESAVVEGTTSAEEESSGHPSSEEEPSDHPSPEEEPSGRPVTPRTRAKSAVLWGAVGFFSFLVLTQGYLLFGDLSIGFAALFVIALFVGVTSGGIAYLTEHRLVAKERV